MGNRQTKVAPSAPPLDIALPPPESHWAIGERIISTKCIARGKYNCEHCVSRKETPGYGVYRGGDEIVQFFEFENEQPPEHFRNMRTVDDILRGHGVIIDEMCIETFPCKHYISIDGQKQCADATEIHDLLSQRGLPIPEHFRH
jgi:hypothetical protein